MQSTDTAVAPTACTREVTEPGGWAALHDPAVQIVVWNRPPEPRIGGFAAAVLATIDFEVRAVVAAGAIAGFDPLPAAARAQDPEAAERLAADIRELLAMFAEFTGARELGVRFARLDEAMCPRFHTDNVGVRLLTTYVGPGTEWLADAEADRSRLGHRSHGVSDRKSGLLRAGAKVRHVPPFAVALLKGAAWPGNAERGAIHRSPAVRGQARVLLSIDVLGQVDGHHGFEVAEFEPITTPERIVLLPRLRRGVLS